MTCIQDYTKDDGIGLCGELAETVSPHEMKRGRVTCPACIQAHTEPQPPKRLVLKAYHVPEPGERCWIGVATWIGGHVGPEDEVDAKTAEEALHFAAMEATLRMTGWSYEQELAITEREKAA